MLTFCVISIVGHFILFLNMPAFLIMQCLSEMCIYACFYNQRKLFQQWDSSRNKRRNNNIIESNHMLHMEMPF